MSGPGSARHRAGRQLPPGGRRIAQPTRPRLGRIAAFSTATIVTAVSVGAAVGMVPTDPRGAAHAATRSPAAGSIVLSSRVQGELPASAGARGDGLSERSGTGRRIVFDQSDQRVWLVNAADKVKRTYLVSGSITDNLDPGSYEVYSRSRWAVGVDDSGVMEYMVRFDKSGGAPIGFHTIPTKHGTALQTTAQLGTPQSHGCIRQDRPDALALWDFAPRGTTVVVIA